MQSNAELNPAHLAKLADAFVNGFKVFTDDEIGSVVGYMTWPFHAGCCTAAAMDLIYGEYTFDDKRRAYIVSLLAALPDYLRQKWARLAELEAEVEKLRLSVSDRAWIVACTMSGCPGALSGSHCSDNCYICRHDYLVAHPDDLARLEGEQK